MDFTKDRGIMRLPSRLLLFGAAAFLLVGATGCGARLKPVVYSDFFGKATAKIATPAKELRDATGVDGGAPNPGKIDQCYDRIGTALTQVEDELDEIAWSGKQGHDLYRAFQRYLKTENDLYKNELADLRNAAKAGDRARVLSLMKQIQDKEQPDLDKVVEAQKKYAQRMTLEVVRARNPTGGKR